MGLTASSVLYIADAAETLLALERGVDPVQRSVARRVHALRSVLLADCLHGEVVKKDRLPVVLRQRYDVRNLYVEDLPAFWRLLYTVGRRGTERYVTVIAIVDHRTCSRWFRRL